MRVWIISLQRTESAIISWAGSIGFYSSYNSFQLSWWNGRVPWETSMRKTNWSTTSRLWLSNLKRALKDKRFSKKVDDPYLFCFVVPLIANKWTLETIETGLLVLDVVRGCLEREYHFIAWNSDDLHACFSEILSELRINTPNRN